MDQTIGIKTVKIDDKNLSVKGTSFLNSSTGNVHFNLPIVQKDMHFHFNMPQGKEELGHSLAGLARKIYNTPGIKDTISFYKYQISLYKADLFRWEDIMPQIFNLLIEHFSLPKGKHGIVALQRVGRGRATALVKDDHSKWSHSVSICNKKWQRVVNQESLDWKFGAVPSAIGKIMTNPCMKITLPPPLPSDLVKSCPKSPNGQHEFIGISCFSDKKACKHCDSDETPSLP